MTYPHLEVQPAKPAPATAPGNCGACGHSKAYHAGGWLRRLPWLAASHCSAWNPDSPTWHCQCRGFEVPA